MRAEVRRLGVDVDGVVGGGLRLAARHPVPVDVLPAVRVDGREAHFERVHAERVEPGEGHPQHGEHPPTGGERKGGKIA